MNQWQIKIKSWWGDLSLREQQVVAIGTTVVGIFLFYLLIWSPYLNRLDQMRKQIRTEQATLAWMQAADSRIKKIENQTKNKNASITPIMLMSLLQKQLKDTGLDTSLTELKQAANDAVELHFQKVAFDQLMSVIETIIKEQNVKITQFTAVSQNAQGSVNVDLVLKLQ